MEEQLHGYCGSIKQDVNSQMARHLISDAHEWMNEIPTVPTCYLVKPQPRERAWQNQRGKLKIELDSSLAL